jgi:hypothetical protein
MRPLELPATKIDRQVGVVRANHQVERVRRAGAHQIAQLRWLMMFSPVSFFSARR